jgi:hypothetical protein
MPRIGLAILVRPDLLLPILCTPHGYLAVGGALARIKQEVGRPFRLFDLRSQITAFFLRPAPLILADVDALVVQLQAVATALRKHAHSTLSTAPTPCRRLTFPYSTDLSNPGRFSVTVSPACRSATRTTYSPECVEGEFSEVAGRGVYALCSGSERGERSVRFLLDGMLRGTKAVMTRVELGGTLFLVAVVGVLLTSRGEKDESS